MAAGDLETLETYISEAEKCLGKEPFKVADYYETAKDIAEDNEISDFQKVRLEKVREEALENSLSDIEDTVEDTDKGVYFRDRMKDLWYSLNELEKFSNDEGMPDKYHGLKQKIAEESYEHIFENSVGIINGEISVLENPGYMDEESLVAKRAMEATEYASAAEEMANYLGESNPADSVHFDHKEVLDSLSEITAELGSSMNIKESRTSFIKLSELTEIYGVSNDLVDKGLNIKENMDSMDFKIGILEDKNHELDDALENSVDISDELHNLEFIIGRARENMESTELPDVIEDDFKERLQAVEQRADHCWAKK